MIKPVDKKEFLDFVKSEQKFGRLKYHHLYTKYKANNKYDKERLKDLFDLTEKEVIKDEVVQT